MTRLGFCTLIAVLIDGFSYIFAAVILAALAYGIIIPIICWVRTGCML